MYLDSYRDKERHVSNDRYAFRSAYFPIHNAVRIPHERTTKKTMMVDKMDGLRKFRLNLWITLCKLAQCYQS